MRRLKFFELPRPLQERFLAATQSVGAPRPLAMRGGRPWAALFWGVLAVAAALCIALVAGRGFGDLSSPSAIAPVSSVGIYVGLFILLFACLIRARVLYEKFQSSPYRRGTYLFASSVIDANGPVLKVYSCEEDGRVKARGRKLTVFAEGKRFSFRGRSPAQVEQVRQQCEQGFAELRALLVGSSTEIDVRSRARLDPLAESDYVNPFTPRSSLAPHAPPWSAMAFALSAVASLLLGWSIWKARNLASERRLYQSAVAGGSVEAFRAYVVRGGKRMDIQDFLLPRAELALARKTGTVSAIEEFAAGHRGSAIQSEVDAALDQALLHELRQAVEKGGLEPLLDFERRHAKHPQIKSALEKQKHRVFVGVRNNFASKVGSQPLLDFVDRLLAYAERHQQSEAARIVEVRFVRRPTVNSDRLDELISKSRSFPGPEFLPSQYFKVADDDRRRALIGEDLVRGLQRAVPKDVLEFRLGKALNDFDAPLPFAELTSPTLYIEHETALSGSYSNRLPPGIWVGLGLKFRVAFAIPGDEKPYRFRFSQWLPPDLARIREQKPSAAAWYENAAAGAYRAFSSKFLATVFKDP